MSTRLACLVVPVLPRPARRRVHLHLVDQCACRRSRAGRPRALPRHGVRLHRHQVRRDAGSTSPSSASRTKSSGPDACPSGGRGRLGVSALRSRGQGVTRRRRSGGNCGRAIQGHRPRRQGGGLRTSSEVDCSNGKFACDPPPSASAPRHCPRTKSGCFASRQPGVLAPRFVRRSERRIGPPIGFHGDARTRACSRLPLRMEARQRQPLTAVRSDYGRRLRVSAGCGGWVSRLDSVR